LSKIYKSNYVSIGTPKPIVNIFGNKAEKGAEAEAVTKDEISCCDEGEAANSIIEDAKQMYMKIIEEANSEAQEIMRAAELEAQKLISDSEEEGYTKGYESGFLKGKEKAQSIIDDAFAIKEFIDKRKESLYKDTEYELLKLVLSIAKKVIGSELEQNKEAILSLVNQALKKCAFKKKLVLKISPHDSEYIIENKNRICMMVEGVSDIEIVPDLSLTKGSCIVETPSGEINSSIDVQINEIEKIFTYLYKTQ